MYTLLLLIVPIVGFAVSLLLSGSLRSAPVLSKGWALLVALAYLALAVLAKPLIGVDVAGPGFLGFTLSYGLTPLSWYFVLMIAFLTLLTVIFSLGALRYAADYPLYYAWLSAKVFGMVGVVLARDLLTFFIMWELMSWATYFLMQQGKADEAKSASFAYLVYAITAGMVLFGGLLFVKAYAGSFAFADIARGLAAADLWVLVTAVILIFIPLLIESAAYPLHGWLPASYAAAETGISAYLASISTRIGVYGVVIFLFSVLGLHTVDRLGVSAHFNFRTILLVLAALTAVLPTFTALFQHDAKQLVTWHSIGQGGYMLLGLATASSFGTAGGLFHIFNHLTYVSLILFSIAAVEHRTGTTNLNKLGGLITKQPVAFLGMLFGIIGLAGIPPMNGFVSKWLIYRSLILGGYPFIALAAFLATIGTILSVYKLIHNTFLGQLPERYESVREVGPAMQIPIWILMGVVLATGVFPGLILGWVAEIQASLGLEAISWTLGGVGAGEGQLNMMVVTGVFTATFIVAAIIFMLGGRRRIVSQYDNYAAGHFLNKNVPYNFNYNFYSAFDHIFEAQYHRAPVKRIEENLSRLIRIKGDYIRRFFTGQVNTYAAYAVAAVLIVLVVLKEVL